MGDNEQSARVAYQQEIPSPLEVRIGLDQCWSTGGRAKKHTCIHTDTCSHTLGHESTSGE